MCGITAVFDPRGVAQADLVRMNDVIRHRGPDSEGYVLLGKAEPRVLAGPDTDPACLRADLPFTPRGQDPTERAATAGLGHRRLSILDLTPAGHQPMSSADGRFWIVLNGEIYNFVELRRELQSLGHRFLGHSDTEVLLAGYAEWGPDVLPRLRGMFAFVLVDTRVGRAFGARDRFGIKPLYYRLRNGRLLVGSEIKQLLLNGGPNRANGPRLYDFLNFSIHDHTDQTMFADIMQLPAGHCMSLSLAEPDRLMVSRWWRLEPRPFEGSLVEAGDVFRDLLQDSVREHLRSDVPVGSCLSGGLDSSSVVCLMRRELDQTDSGQVQRTFTATSSEAAIDESNWARMVVDRVNADSHWVQPDMAALPELLPDLTWHMDEPFGSSSVLAQWSVFRLARDSGTKVVLDGQGADEQLAGYSTFFGLRLAELARSGRVRELKREVRAIQRLHPGALRNALMTVGYLTVPTVLARPVGRRIGASGQRPDDWLSRRSLGVSGFPDPNASSGGRVRSVNGLGVAQLTATNLPKLLHYEDRDSMAHSVEARVPFLDHRLVEFSTGLPSDFLLSEGITKRVLREALRGTIPEPIRTRIDKIGFETAEEQWIRAHSGQVRSLLDDSIESLGGALTPGVLTRYDNVIAGREPFDQWIWRCISAGTWARRFGVVVGHG
ncbi:MAG: asparagine synthase (glutamine-hydrolyzing) [Candidatus Nanopelagicales bacterium]